MKRFLATPLVLLMLAAPSPAATKITGTLTAKVGQLVNLQAETDVAGAALIWDVFSGGSEVAETYENSAEKRLIFAGVAGTYTVKVRAISFKDNVTRVETARATVTIGDAPTPGPGPAPPTPPAPDALTASLQAAYRLDGPDPASLTTLKNLYGGMSVLVSANQVSSDISTVGGAYAWGKGVVEAPSTGLGTTKLQNTRKAVAAYMTQKFGQTGAAPIDRAKFAAELKTVSDALAGVK